VIEFGHVPATQVQDVEVTKVDAAPNDEWMQVDQIKGHNKKTISLAIPAINVSCISRENEVLVMVLYDIRLKRVTTELETVVEAYMGRLQIDNAYDREPLFPVLLSPKCMSDKDTTHDHF
jgi:hypothetical protein